MVLLQIPRGRVEDDLPAAGTELREICGLIQEELERYCNPPAGPRT